jgi:hypothetical protein
MRPITESKGPDKSGYMLQPVKALPWLALLAACGGGGDLPDGWDGARPLALGQAACSSVPFAGLPRVTLSTGSDGVVTGLLETVIRCPQPVCGYLIDAGARARVLIQPCEMHPREVTKCAWPARVTFTLPASARRTSVEVWARPDFYGQTGANDPALVPAR